MSHASFAIAAFSMSSCGVQPSSGKRAKGKLVVQHGKWVRQEEAERARADARYRGPSRTSGVRGMEQRIRLEKKVVERWRSENRTQKRAERPEA